MIHSALDSLPLLVIAVLCFVVVMFAISDSSRTRNLNKLINAVGRFFQRSRFPWRRGNAI